MTRNLSSHITCSPMLAAVTQLPQQPCDHDGFCNCVWSWPFDLQVNACQATVESTCIYASRLVLIAQAILLLQSGHIHRQPDRPTHPPTHTHKHTVTLSHALAMLARD